MLAGPPRYSHIIQAEIGDVIKQSCRCNQVATNIQEFPDFELFDHTGKTLSARHYAQWDRIEAAQARWQSPSRVVPTEVADCYTVFYTPPVANTPRGIEYAVEEHCAMLTDLVKAA